MSSGNDASSSRAADEEQPGKPRNALQRARDFIFGGKIDKAKMQSLGLGFIIAYGFVSNVTYGTVVTIGWSTHVAATGLTPFAEGQMAPFLTRIAGLLALQHLLRPIRFSCAVALTPVVDRIMGFLQRRFNVHKRGAFVMMFISLACVTLLCFAVALASVTIYNSPK